MAQTILNLSKIDLSNYTEAELLELNRRLINHVKATRREASFDAMTTFNYGDMVRSKLNVRPARLAGLEGKIVKFARTRISVMTKIGIVRFTPNAIEKISSSKKSK